MKTLSILIGIMLLAGCSSMHTSGSGTAGGTTGMSNDYANKPVFQRPFNPDDPYHGS